MEAIVHQALGHILFSYPGNCLERPQIKNALVRHPLVSASVQHRESPTKLAGQVVGRQDGHFARIGQLRPHHGDVHPADRQDARTAPGRSADRAIVRVQARHRHHRMTGDERLEVCTDANRPHAWAAATVRDAEGLVQVHVRDIGANVSRPRETDLGVQVGAVHVDLATVLVHDLTDFPNALLIHTMCRRVGNHQAGQPLACSIGLGLEVVEVNVAIVIAVDDHHFHASHLRRSRVGAVGRRRDQAQRALRLMTAAVVTGDCHQPGVFALGT
ncbi:hypothetical protein D3C81_1337620 [compost metagenome]